MSLSEPLVKRCLLHFTKILILLNCIYMLVPLTKNVKVTMKKANAEASVTSSCNKGLLDNMWITDSHLDSSSNSSLLFDFWYLYMPKLHLIWLWCGNRKILNVLILLFCLLYIIFMFCTWLYGFSSFLCPFLRDNRKSLQWVWRNLSYFSRVYLPRVKRCCGSQKTAENLCKGFRKIWRLPSKCCWNESWAVTVFYPQHDAGVESISMESEATQ